MKEAHSVSQEVPRTVEGERLDRVVALIADISRSHASELVNSGSVTVDGKTQVKASIRLVAGQVVEFKFSEPDLSIKPDSSVEFPIIYSDDDLAVIDKPADLVVHPGSGVTEGTLVNGLLSRFPQIDGIGDQNRPGIVHRLDRGTSGLMVAALSQDAYDKLSQMMADHSVQRVYTALVEGDVQSESGKVDAPIGRSIKDPTKRAVMASGKHAVTEYEVVERIGGATVLKVALQTGRTHQIRVHMAAIGHPVVGDQKYGTAGDAPRLFLHSNRIGFVHPIDGSQVDFTVGLPPELEQYQASLR